MPEASALRPIQMACVTCTAAKRKCTKDMPSCRRCVDKELSCKYPSPKVTIPLDMIICEEAVPAPETDTGSLLAASTSTALSRVPAEGAWFLSPDSWSVDYRPTHHCSPQFGHGDLHRFMARIQSWLAEWVTEGRCPFIHARLYRESPPGCIQDAFATAAAYLAKTPATKELVLGILESRANGLMESQEDAISDMDVPALDTVSHLSRTQALLVYQIMRLSDGDIRSRQQAERSMDTLGLWASQMWDSASLDIFSASMGCSAMDPQAANTQQKTANVFHVDNNISLFWRAWYVGESVRRTFLIAVLLQGVYLNLTQGWSPCPGGVTVTARQGLWDATSPHAWLQVFRQDTLSPLRVRTIKSARLFLEARPAEVDEFTNAILSVSHGLERVEQWVAEKSG